MEQPVGLHNPVTLHECSGAMDCAVTAAGHGLALIHERVAAATPGRWRDAVVTAVGADGWVELTTVDDHTALGIWNHAGLDGVLAQGDPVALHGVYGVLAIGSARLNVLVSDQATR
jgi:hypothetical protein